VRRRSIGFPLTIAVVLSLLALALGVGWQFLVVSDLAPVARGLTGVHWLLLISGAVFFLLIIVGLVLLCAWLVREMRFNQRQEAFLDAVTHEMKTPLASLRLYLDTLRARTPPPERQREFLSHMGEDVDRLQRTVELVLAAARAEHRAVRTAPTGGSGRPAEPLHRRGALAARPAGGGGPARQHRRSPGGAR